MRTAIDSLSLAPALTRALALALLALGILLPACSDDDSATPTDTGTTPTVAPSPGGTPGPDGGGNLFLNPGFEEGSDPWYSLNPVTSFVRTEERPHTGTGSAFFKMRDPATAEGAKVYYLIQEVTPEQFPETVSGYYRVENWNKGTIRQYLQFVVIAFGPKNFPTTSPNYQIRYLLAGIDSPPFAIGNAYFVFLSREEPVQGEWVHFEVPVKEDFENLWGAAPEDYEKLRILFEVRWDEKAAGDGAPEADVYYDDLYIGPPQGG